MHIIKGHYRNESGDLSIGTLLVEQANGKFRDAESGARLVANHYAVAQGITGIEITSPDSLIEFLPDAGEIDRIGMSVA